MSYIYKYIIPADCILFLACLLGIYQISLKAYLPFSVAGGDNGIAVIDTPAGLSIKPGDKLIAIDGIAISSREQIEVYLDSKNTGENITAKIRNSFGSRNISLSLVHFYPVYYKFMALAAGILFFLISVFVLLKSASRRQALAFHNVTVSAAVIIMTTWGNYNTYPEGSGYAVRFLFHTAYALAPTLFLHFTLIFPTDRMRKPLIISAYMVSAMLLTALNIQFMNMSGSYSAETSAEYIRWFNYARYYIILCVLLSIVIFAKTYNGLSSEADRKKLKWILLGFILGPVSFVLLWVLPQSITTYGLMPEEAVLILMSAIPITFGIAIVKYHLYDIDLIINRSIVYTIALSLLTILYAAIVFAAAYVISSRYIFISTLAAVIMALVFQPVKTKTQKLVDKKFFRVRYNFREAIGSAFRLLQSSNSIPDLAETLLTETGKLIPVRNAAFFSYNRYGNYICLISHRNFPLFACHKIFLSTQSAGFLESLPVAAGNSTEHEVPVRAFHCPALEKRNIALVFPVTASGELLGLLTTGSKKSGDKYYVEDYDLLIQLCSETAVSWERIMLQESIIRERLEKNRLKELNQMKSFFVSSVSHEFKTPLTSIRLFSELIGKDHHIENRDRYLSIIRGESDRLSQMLDNVLDLTRIERGIKQYSFKFCDLNNIVKSALEIMEYQLIMHGFQVHKIYSFQNPVIMADSDAVTECIVNLISNTIKYSADEKVLCVETRSSAGEHLLIIEDHGIGIHADELEKIFEPYYRSSHDENGVIPGTGLGLAIVKHTMDAHHGSIRIKSELDKGTTITLVFPAGNMINREQSK